MTAAPQHTTKRKGWCPGALRPMQTGDGLLVRVKFSASRVACATARELATLSARYGNGILDLSQRANLQFRGVTDETLPDLIDALRDLNLLDDDVGSEAVRNILVSPLAGIDPQATDVENIVMALERALKTETRLHELPGKFSFSIDAGGNHPLGATSSDITITMLGDSNKCRITLCGAGDVAVDVGTASAAAAVVMIADVFLSHRSTAPELNRMRDLIARDRADVVFTQSGLTSIRCSTETTPTLSPDRIGRLQLSATQHIAAIGLPFGRITSEQLANLAVAAEHAECAKLHLTPWRSMFVPVRTDADADAVLAAAKMSGLVTDASDPRLAIDACPGRPACSSGEAHTLADAATLADHLGFSGLQLEPGLVHVSGCAKGCARRQASHITLVGNNGLYDLIINGTTETPPYQSGITSVDLVSTVQDALRTTAQKNIQGAASRG